ncbi:oligosaccharide flippase family protein [Suttonella sp. R2A3]|uniref:lipopolysaccharide biosynthesis protein n=1 Tax=Suttonella sp. R2A3 TaxID=2908648 RepID=UPI001F3EFD27|nr:oligosaccharide flippase family protein [Suttonella sp. R2A3]UJF25331.1 oligosaccharide flippase family protein [Suttonella sp. R2A3]
MLAINKKLLGKGGIFLFANILNAAIPFFMLPILTRVLTPEDYGIVAMFAIFLSFANTFVGLSVHGAINVQYFKLEQKRFSEYVTNCLILLLISASLVFLTVLLLGSYFESVVGIPYKWMLIGVTVSFFQFLITIRLSIWVVTGAAKEYGSLQVSRTFVNAGLSLFFIFSIGLLWEGRLLGQVVAAVAFGILAFILVTRSGYLVKPQNTKSDIKNALLFGLPLIPHAIGGFLMVSTDRVMLANMLDITVVGIYMVGLQLGQAMSLLADSFNKVYAPWIMKNLSNPEINKEKLVKNSYIMMIAFLVVGLLWGLVAMIGLPYIVGERFMAAKSVIIYMCLAHAFTALYNIVGNYIFYAEKTKVLAIITFSVAIINIPLTYFLVRIYGIEGAALAFLIAQILFFLATWFLSNKVLPMPWLTFLKVKQNA